MADFDIDKVLISIGGWGKFQKLNYFVLCCVIAFSVFPMSYIFTARDIKYRCLIESCDEDFLEYNPAWLKNAVPFIEDFPSSCSYYSARSEKTCSEFNKSKILRCNKFVYEMNQTTIVQDFKIFCEKNLWKLTIVGTINVIGELFCLPFAGYISDRYGRKVMVLVSVFLSTISGCLRSFSNSYYMFVAFEFIDTALGSGIYSGSFILALEIVDSKRRNMGNTIICIAFAFGQAILGTAAWFSPSWRILLRIIYLPGFLVTISLWFIPESVRWLISKKRLEDARAILQRIAKLNGRMLDQQDLEFLASASDNINNAGNQDKSIPLWSVLKSKQLLIRTIHCSFTWICCNFPYYGLTIQSVAISENIYINFICTALVEIPAYFLTYGSIDRFGRKKSLGISLILAGIFCLAVDTVRNLAWLSLALFLCGKFFMTTAYTTLYIFTAEMFPTDARHSTFAICSMFGRFGSMLAPQVPLLTRYMKSLPLLIFSAMALSAGTLSFWFPETHNTKLPDKVDEALKVEAASISHTT